MTLFENLEKVFSLFPKLAERKKQLAGAMSGGEALMLAIARGVMSNAGFLCIDEPSLGLQPNLRLEVVEIIREINEEGKSILLMEHNIPQVTELADRIYLLEVDSITFEARFPFSSLLAVFQSVPLDLTEQLSQRSRYNRLLDTVKSFEPVEELVFACFPAILRKRVPRGVRVKSRHCRDLYEASIDEGSDYIRTGSPQRVDTRQRFPRFENQLHSPPNSVYGSDRFGGPVAFAYARDVKTESKPVGGFLRYASTPFSRGSTGTRRSARRTHRQAGEKNRPAFSQAGRARGDVRIRKAPSNLQIDRKDQTARNIRASLSPG